MESGSNISSSDDVIESFMKEPLVTWVRTFESDGGGSLTYEALADGVFLYDVMDQIDPPVVDSCQGVNRHPQDPLSKLGNLYTLLHRIINFYKEVVGQQVMLTLPDLPVLAHSCKSPAAVAELKQLLLLVLGCAVQCHKKEQLVNTMTSALTEDTLLHLMEYIKQIQLNPDAVWCSDWCTLEGVAEAERSAVYGKLVGHCQRLTRERDHYCLEWLRVSCSGADSSTPPPSSTSPSALPTLNSSSTTPVSSSELPLQLAGLKAELRKLKQEHEEKCEALTESKEDAKQYRDLVDKLRQENVTLTQEARSARMYRDEGDMLKERAAKVDILEAEVAKFKEKMQDVQYYKSRNEELREDMKILSDHKDMLEDQLETARKKSDQIVELENTIMQLTKQINQLKQERAHDRESMEQLMELNSELQLSARNSINESSSLMSEIDRLKHNTSIGSSMNSISDDLNSDANTRIMKLKLENQRLEAELETLKFESASKVSEKVKELEDENRRLATKVEEQRVKERHEQTQLLTAQEQCEQHRSEAKRLRDTLNTVKENTQRQCKEIQDEKCQLEDMLQTLRERQKKSSDARLLDVENENRSLMDTNLQLQSQVSRLDYEKQQMQRLTDRLRESADRLEEVEHQKTEMEKEIRNLKENISILKKSCEEHGKVEQDHANLELEFARVSRKLENTMSTLSELESVQNDKIQLQAEVDRLKLKLKSLKESSARLADLEGDKVSWSLEMTQLQQQINQLQQENNKIQQLDLDLMAAGNESQKLKRSIDACHKKIKDVEKEKTDLESENAKLLRTVETLKLNTKKLNELEKDLTELEGSNDRLERDNRSLLKEVQRLKDTLEVKDGLAEEWSTKAASLQRANTKMSRQLEELTSSDNKVRELSLEKTQLEQQVQRERKTLSALREDLITEKVHTQQLSNELEILTADLVKLGLNPSNLSSAASHAQINSADSTTSLGVGRSERFSALESMLEETLKSSMEVRDEKIASLESRLNESVSRNSQLRQQLLQVRADYESLLQRQQEGGGGYDGDKELLSLKVILQRTNEEKVSLESEINSLTSQASRYREQVCALQSQVTSLADQNTVMSKHNAQLQGNNARLQVENTTLQSQSASLIAQNTALQTTASQHEADRDKAQQQSEERWSRLSQLSNDHESLQRLHEQLQRDYDSLSHDYTLLKQQTKEIKQENKTLKERQSSLSASEDELLRMKEQLECEMDNLKSDSMTLSNLRAEHSKLKDDFRSLFSSNEKLRCEYKNLQSDYKTIKTEKNSLKLRTTELSGELNDSRDQLASLDVEVAKLTNKCQVLQDTNSRLDEDRKSLMGQVTQLLGQYHDLLSHTMEDKNMHHQEEKCLADKLNNLQRQKEKLEEKIMEQYRRMDNTNKTKRGFGSNLVRRVRKAGNELISRVPRSGRSRSRGREDGSGGMEESPDSSSLSSHVNESSSLDSLSETRRSSPTLTEDGSTTPHHHHSHHHLGGVGASQNNINHHGGRRESLGSVSILTNGGPYNSTTLANATISTTPQHYQHRKSLPPSISELFLNHSMRGSISSEEVQTSLRSDVSETLKEGTDGDSLGGSSMPPSLSYSVNSSSSPTSNSPTLPVTPHTPTSGFILGVTSNGTPNCWSSSSPAVMSNGGGGSSSSNGVHHSRDSSLELSRAGSRRPLCVTDEHDEAVSRSRSSSRNAMAAPPQVKNNSVCPPLTSGRSATPGGPPSTPKTPVHEPTDGIPDTPKLPPRLHNVSGPQIPPRCRRDVITPTSLDLHTPTLPRHSNARPPAPPPKPTNNNKHDVTSPSNDDVMSVTASETGSAKERRVANSVWYEYGCV